MVQASTYHPMQRQNIRQLQYCFCHNEQLSLCAGNYRILSESPSRSIDLQLLRNKDTILFYRQAIRTVCLGMYNFLPRLLKNLRNL